MKLDQHEKVAAWLARGKLMLNVHAEVTAWFGRTKMESI